MYLMIWLLFLNLCSKFSVIEAQDFEYIYPGYTNNELVIKWKLIGPNISEEFHFIAESTSTDKVIIPVQPGTSKVSISGLTPCNHYKFAVVDNKTSHMTKNKLQFTIPAKGKSPSLSIYDSTAPIPVTNIQILAKNSQRIEVVANDPSMKSTCGDYRYYINVIDTVQSIVVFSAMSLRPFFSADSLNPGSSYQILIYSVELNSGRKSNIVTQSYANTATGTASFKAPSYFYATNITTSSVIFSWAPETASTLSNYLLTYWSSKEELQKISITNAPNKTLDRLRSCTYYQATVQSIPEMTDSRERLDGDQARFLLLKTLPKAYTRQVNYTKEMVDSTTAIFSFILDEGALDSCAFMLDGLSPNTAYNLSMLVREMNTGENGPSTNTTFKTTDSNVLNSPIVSPTIVSNRESSVILAWVSPNVPPNKKLENYEITYASAVDDKMSVLLTNSSNQFFKLTDLTPCTDYWFAVRVILKYLNGSSDSTKPYSNRLETDILISRPAPVDSIEAKYINTGSLIAEIEDSAIRPSCGSYKYLATLTNSQNGLQLNKSLRSEKCEFAVDFVGC
ncbi:hypothetical protein Ciccas_011342 [Cichlidogyrus casuarinus]|uniref:Fibronectin type-III domain-containing protein n=1 Tax=Cichlidogyrus casuarinus TaxID=1844966 RepID=A0ABD2PRX3_9PLAT